MHCLLPKFIHSTAYHVQIQGNVPKITLLAVSSQFLGILCHYEVCFQHISALFLVLSYIYGI